MSTTAIGLTLVGLLLVQLAFTNDFSRIQFDGSTHLPSIKRYLP